jgi:hypothetical protein
MSPLTTRFPFERVNARDYRWLWKAQRAGQEADVPYTHDHAAVAGIYVTADTCHARVTMAIGHEFPPCPKCGRSTTYTRVEAPKT